LADDTNAQPDPTLNDDPTPPAAGDGENRSPSWLERMEARRAAPQDVARDSLPVRPDDRRPVAVVGPEASHVTTPGALQSPVTDLQEVGVSRLRDEAIRVAREDAAAGVPQESSPGPTGSEQDLRDRCRAFFDRWSFQYRRWLHNEVAEHEEQITDKLGRASLAVDRFERLTNELLRLKARRALRHREVTDELGKDAQDRGIQTRIYLLAITFLGLVEFFANAPVFQALLPRDVLTERQIRLVAETSEGWFAGAERVFAQILLRPDAALLAAGVVTFLCVLAHFFGHSLRDLVMQHDQEERHHTVAVKSKMENVIPMALTALGLILVLGVLYEARIRLGQVGEEQYQQDTIVVEELRRQAGFLRADGNLLEANARLNRADDMQGAAVLLREYAGSMSRLSFPILLLNTTLVICALSAAYFHRRDRRREHFNESPFERERLEFIEAAEGTASDVTTFLADLAKRIRSLKTVAVASALEEPRAMVRELESVIALYRAENGRARGLDPRTIAAFQEPVALGIEIEVEDAGAIEPLRSPEQYDGERHGLAQRFEEARQRFNQEAIAW
jgi:hypothetical protein